MECQMELGGFHALKIYSDRQLHSKTGYLLFKNFNEVSKLMRG